MRPSTMELSNDGRVVPPKRGASAPSGIRAGGRDDIPAASRPNERAWIRRVDGRPLRFRPPCCRHAAAGRRRLAAGARRVLVLRDRRCRPARRGGSHFHGLCHRTVDLLPYLCLHHRVGIVRGRPRRLGAGAAPGGTDYFGADRGLFLSGALSPQRRAAPVEWLSGSGRRRRGNRRGHRDFRHTSFRDAPSDSHCRRGRVPGAVRVRPGAGIAAAIGARPVRAGRGSVGRSPPVSHRSADRAAGGRRLARLRRLGSRTPLFAPLRHLHRQCRQAQAGVGLSHRRSAGRKDQGRVFARNDADQGRRFGLSLFGEEHPDFARRRHRPGALALRSESAGRRRSLRRHLPWRRLLRETRRRAG